MRFLLILLTCLACADALAQARFRPGPSPREDTPRSTDEGRARNADDLRERRESLRAFRDEMRQQQETQRRDVRDGRDERSRQYVDPRTEDDGHNLRRLSPEDRRRMRQEMRDAFRR